MANKKTSTPAELPRPLLLVSKQEAENKIDERIKKGRELVERPIANPEELDRARAERKSWHDYNIELLAVLFDNEKYSKQYVRDSQVGIMSLGYQSFFDDIKDYRESVQRKINALESIRGFLELIPEKQPNTAKDAKLPVSELRADTKTVFVVHGHDETLKEQVARVLSALGLDPVILHEQENQGRTLIEKFEHNAGKSSYAIVLLTPDDRAYAVAEGSEQEESRARQNVVLELGYFMGFLGRDRVCALYRAGVRLPTDINGLAYVPVNEGDEGWKLLLGKELRAAGFNADLNKL